MPFFCLSRPWMTPSGPILTWPSPAAASMLTAGATSCGEAPREPDVALPSRAGLPSRAVRARTLPSPSSVSIQAEYLAQYAIVAARCQDAKGFAGGTQRARVGSAGSVRRQTRGSNAVLPMGRGVSSLPGAPAAGLGCLSRASDPASAETGHSTGGGRRHERRIPAGHDSLRAVTGADFSGCVPSAARGVILQDMLLENHTGPGELRKKT